MLTRSELGRRLAVATMSSGVIWIAGTLATFLVGVILARRLGPEGYGIYGTAVAVATLLAVPAQLGLPLLATREVSAARARNRADDAAALAWWFAAMVAAASVLIGIALRLAIEVLPLAPALMQPLATAAILLPALALSSLTTGLLRGQERVVTSQLLDVLVRPLAFAALLLAGSQPLGIPAALGAQTLAAAAIALIGFTLFWRRIPLLARRAAPRVRAWTAAALPMMLMEAMRTLEGNYGVLVTSYAASTADAGLLRVAMACSVAVSVPISLQNIVVAPFLAGAHAADEPHRLARIVAGSTVFMTVSVGAATLAIAIAGQWALPFAFGTAFAGAYWPLLVLSCNQLLIAMFGPGVILLSMTGHERVVARAFTASVAAAVVAGVLLVPWFGAVGVAASALVATLVRGGMLNRFARRTLGIEPSLLGAAGLFGVVSMRSRHLRAPPLGRGPDLR
ncbi:lipopolysaccharide biosynthesis protein [Novosphingobium sp. CF614]|uniref:lipopolysaccharide biosynthesis protein n=1 Tax=Novosphingobium sp. CF614 TaxID=1884364 RepID=UPI0015A5C841|nr:lipopolysaccharide biosynthesis protein [Novosphingobium sp. CF614]